MPKRLNASRAWLDFKSRYPRSTVMRWNTNSGTPHRIVAAGITLAPLIDESTIADVSRGFINEYSELLGASTADLRLSKAGFFGRMWYVIFDRYYKGLPVYNARVKLSFNSDGALVSFGSDAYPNIDIDTTPTVSRGRAVDVIREELGSYTEDDGLESIQLYILPLSTERDFSIRLTWKAFYRTSNPVARWCVFVDAHTGELLLLWDTILYDFTGNVSGDVQLDGPFDDFVSRPFKDLTVTAEGIGTDETDANGDYNIPGSGSATITAELKGPFIDVNFNDGPDAYFSGSSSGELDIDWTSISDPQERDAYFHTIIAHDYIKYVDPAFSGMDFQVSCVVNGTECCGARWVVDRMEFFRGGGDCVECEANMAQMPTVVYHEYGHGITQYVYYPHDPPSGTEGKGMNEGWSYFIADCITDQPQSGRGWYGPGTFERTSDNDLNYDDNNCGTDEHCWGIMLAGMLWHMRENMIDSFGDEIKTYVDSLWHYPRENEPLDFPDYLEDLLDWDDDNGDRSDGTPHFYEICAGFSRHGLECSEVNYQIDYNLYLCDEVYDGQGGPVDDGFRFVSCTAVIPEQHNLTITSEYTSTVLYFYPLTKIVSLGTLLAFASSDRPIDVHRSDPEDARVISLKGDINLQNGGSLKVY